MSQHFNHCTCPPMDLDKRDPRCPHMGDVESEHRPYAYEIQETTDERDRRLDRERGARLDAAKDRAAEGAESPIDKFRRVFES